MRLSFFAFVYALSVSWAVEGGLRGTDIHEQFKKQLEELKNSRKGLPVSHNVSIELATERFQAGPAPSAPEPESKKPVEMFVEMPLDHNGTTNATFKNRYWIYDGVYVPGSPIFVFDGGENDIEGTVDIWLTEPSSFFYDFLKEFSGLGIAWEHRYYGKSVPETISTATSPEMLQYLTTEQALEDFVYFAEKFELANYTSSELDLTPKGTPWIFVGGSYPGMRATFLRQKYPNTVFAAYAGAAPVQARIEMGSFYEQIYRGMVHYGLASCANTIRSGIKYIDGELTKGGDAAAYIKKMFLGRGGDENSNGHFAQLLATHFWAFQNGGIDGGLGSGGASEWTIKALCDYLTKRYVSGEEKIAPEEGWEAEMGGAWIAEHWAMYPNIKLMGDWYGGGHCGGYKTMNVTDSLSGYYNCDLEWIWSNPNDVSWRWQYCTEWGYFQVANVGPNQIVSKFVDVEYQKGLCHAQFPTGNSSGFLPDFPNADRMNSIYGGFSPGSHQSRTFYTGGQFDPWGTLSFFSNETFRPAGLGISQRIPGCNEKTPNSEIFGYLIPESQHLADFLGGEASKPTRDLFKEALRTWLPCWENRTIEQPGSTGLSGNITTRPAIPVTNVTLIVNGTGPAPLVNGTVGRIMDIMRNTTSRIKERGPEARGLRRRSREWWA
ncbi:hypothetical protein ABW19_dt0208639 [Dactylella cylindrospora]|nr:hypothetical protein ABW19_dt0208639 [Dactylella cylindrospora]